jgi:hypothetical protein
MALHAFVVLLLRIVPKEPRPVRSGVQFNLLICYTGWLVVPIFNRRAQHICSGFSEFVSSVHNFSYSVGMF